MKRGHGAGAILAVVAALWAPGIAAAHPGALDPSFGGGDGQVTQGFGAFSASATSVATTTDGGLIIAGKVATAGVAFNIGLLALDATGTARAGFAAGGSLDIPVPAPNSVTGNVTVAQRPDGSYLVGATAANGPATEILVASVSAAGFASPVSVVPLPAGLSSATGIAVDGSSGFVYVAGAAGAKTLGLVRLTAAGTLDTSFGVGGIAQQAIDAGANATVGRVIEQSDGKLIVVANGTQADNTTHEISAIRFTSGGQLDGSYGVGGAATLPNTSATLEGAALGKVAISAAGIAVIGNRTTGGLQVVRFTPGGQPATTFGGTGAVPVGNGGFAEPTDLTLGDDGSVIVIGDDTVSTAGGIGARTSAYANRLNPDGSHDATFGDNPINGYGAFTSWFNGTTDAYAQRASVLTAAGLVAVGDYDNHAGGPPTQFAAARIITAPDPPNKPPVVSLAANPTSTSTAKPLVFTATASDADGSVVRYEWDFDGDGVTDRVTAAPTTSYQFTRAGSFTARITVTDNAGATATATTPVTVVSAASLALTALRHVKGKLTLAKTASHGRRSLSDVLAKIGLASCPCPYFAMLRRGSTLLDAKAATLDARRTKITFAVKVKRRDKLTETVRVFDTFGNRLNVTLKLTVK